MSDGNDSGATTRPTLRVVRGGPDAEELAAVVAVVSAAGGVEDSATVRPVRGRWADPAALSRRVPAPGPGGWRAAGR